MARVARVGGEYEADHLTHLEGLDAVRKRPGMYIGSTDSRGVNHLVNEILDNAVDEAVAGFCSEITVTLHPDGSVEVADSGRGIPVDVNTKTGLSGVELVFTRLHAGGKFGGKSYNTSGGLHGVGASVVNALSLRLDVTVRRGGRVHTVSFQHGVSGRFDGAGAKAVFTPAVGLRVVGKCPAGQTGTTIRYWYDPAYFLPGAEFQVDALVTKLRNTAFLVPGLSLTLRDARGGAIDEQTFWFPDGLADMVDFLTPAGDRGVCDTLVFTGEGTYRENAADENGVMRTNVERRCEVEVAVRWGTGYETTMECFTNVIRNVHGGTHRKGFERGLTRVLVDTIRNTRGLLKANEDPPVLDDILEGLVAVVHVRVPEPQFTSQTKDELSTAGVAKAVQAVVEREVKAWLDGRRTKPQARVVLEKIVAAARVRLVQKQQKETARRKTALEGGSMPAKLADCRETGVARSELFIVEGDSAAGCFSGDTRVALVDGRSLTFAELAADWQSGVMHFGYATDEFGDVLVVPLDAPRITKRGAALVAVTLDNGEVLRCTPDHLFRLRDGSYRRADALKGSDSLMPLYRDLSRKDRGHSIDGYERVFLNSTGRWQYTHHLADAWNLSQGLDSQGNGPVRHHVDFNKRNNDPRNLVRMTKEGHWEYHQYLISHPRVEAGYRAWLAAGGREVMSQRMKEQWQDPTTAPSWTANNVRNGRDAAAIAARAAGFQTWWESLSDDDRAAYCEEMRQRQTEYWADPEARQAARERVLAFFADPARRAEWSRMAREEWADPQLRAWRSAETRRFFEDPAQRERQRQAVAWRERSPEWVAADTARRQPGGDIYVAVRAGNAAYFANEAAADHGRKTTDGRRMAALRRLAPFTHLDDDGMRAAYEQVRKQEATRGALTFETLMSRFDSIDALRDAASKLNHKVVRVEPLTETEDVYDLTVDTYHNFALEAGVFVHNSAKKGRSSEYQAILPIRGKILNVAKASLKAALENAECAAIIQTVGAGSGRTFDVERMRYQRVIVLADADVDGAHIRCLLLTFFYRYMRPMVEAGRLYAAMPPLYRITTRGQGSETVLAYTQADMESTVRRLEGQGKQILTPIPRFKGLGEMDAGELWQSTMNPATRSVRRITVDDAAQAETYLDLLMGDRVEPRRDWIVEFGDQVDRDALDA